MDGVEEIEDLKAGMILEGTVTNVTNFGAFVDIGVHQDGLVHISSLSEKFVEDPHQVVKTGDVVKVKVLEVDLSRKRISLTMKLGAPVAAPTEKRGGRAPQRTGGMRKPQPQKATEQSAMAAAFAKMKKDH